MDTQGGRVRLCRLRTAHGAASEGSVRIIGAMDVFCRNGFLAEKGKDVLS